MPTEVEGFDSPHMLIEYRGIRGGEKGEKAPIKTPLRVRLPNRDKDRKLPPDIAVMESAARRLGIDPKNWHQVREVPVLLLSDKVVGEDGVVFVERALYSGRGRLCASMMGELKAQQRVDPAAYLKARGKNVKIRDNSNEVDCTPECPLWLSAEDRAKGKNSDCKWRAIVTVQLLDSPIFPSPARMRTRSFYSIMSLITSLNFISSVTGGVLMGIPLWLRQSLIDIRQATGELRKIPVTSFDFRGPLQELRRLAVVELASRQALKDAGNGKIEAPVIRSFVDHDLGGGESMADEPEPDPIDDAEPPASTAIQVSSEVALLYKKLGFPPARQRAIEDKHHGDLDAILAELKTLTPEGFDPSPGDPGHDTSETEASPPEPGDNQDFLNEDLFD